MYQIELKIEKNKELVLEAFYTLFNRLPLSGVGQAFDEREEYET